MGGVVASKMAQKPRTVFHADADVRAWPPPTERKHLSVAPEGNSLFLVVEPMTVGGKGGGKSFWVATDFPKDEKLSRKNSD